MERWVGFETEHLWSQYVLYMFGPIAQIAGVDVVSLNDRAQPGENNKSINFINYSAQEAVNRKGI